MLRSHFWLVVGLILLAAGLSQTSACGETIDPNIIKPPIRTENP